MNKIISYIIDKEVKWIEGEGFTVLKKNRLIDFAIKLLLKFNIIKRTMIKHIEYGRIEINNQRIDLAIQKQYDNFMMREGKFPDTLVLGREQYVDLLKADSLNHYMALNPATGMYKHMKLILHPYIDGFVLLAGFMKDYQQY